MMHFLTSSAGRRIKSEQLLELVEAAAPPVLVVLDALSAWQVLVSEFREVTPPARLVYTWQWEDDADYVDRETLVTVEFIDL